MVGSGRGRGGGGGTLETRKLGGGTGFVKAGKWIFFEYGVGTRDRVDRVGGLEVNKLAVGVEDDTIYEVVEEEMVEKDEVGPTGLAETVSTIMWGRVTGERALDLSRMESMGKPEVRRLRGFLV